MNQTELNEWEVELTGRVTSAFPTHALTVVPVDVITDEGGTRPTLRFTLDDAFSTDIDREATSSASLDLVADDLINDLRQQVG